VKILIPVISTLEISVRENTYPRTKTFNSAFIVDGFDNTKIIRNLEMLLPIMAI